ncbi:DUF4178 domain-containing protein [Nocardiopsis suaedae]|uniref:DUF4178 domain-containing protein n=1 Tax=Nocardiopsis suaedae TaxID=3018444 RepID=A0ABT4TQ51_9ACTN|nr:DUF4178 domain-containing protein [Nocardiopsis suaedae]MDA2806814.1 DUF4178 domain-containing protein [Nocardiopsis suaedae]
MDTLTTVVLILLGALVVLGAAILIAQLRRRDRPAPSAPPAPRDPFADVGDINGDPLALRAGDMIELGAERSWVRGTLRLSEGGAQWAEHFVDAQGTDTGGGQAARRWLSVEEDPDLQMALWTARPEVDLVPGPSSLELDGVRYRLSERGSASYRSEGTTGLRASGGMDYADYEADDGSLLSFERFDHGGWEAATGTPVQRGALTVYSSGASEGPGA